MRNKAKRSSLQLILGLSFAALIILSACSTSAPPEPNQVVVVQDPQPQEQPQSEVPTSTEPATAFVNADGYPAPAPDQRSERGTPEGGYPAPEDQLQTSGDQIGGYTSPGEGYPPLVKTELQATNPSTVKLASGELQLVEFFAFW